jgi:type IV secretory pathway TrbD component
VRDRTSEQYLMGFRSPVYDALWKRILLWGGPRVLSALWVVCCLYAALLLLFMHRPSWWLEVAVVGAVWIGGQAGIVLITQWDQSFDAVLLASPRYRTFYDAG